MKRLLSCVAMIVLLPWLWATISADAAGKDNQQAVASQTPAAAPANGNVGSEVCATCHADVATQFSTNPHAKLALLHGGKGVTCESCHGPGEAHVASGGDVTKILQLNKLSAKKLDATCLGCHESVHPNFERSPHAQANVSCISCHSVHKSTSEAGLLKASQPMLCYQCHSDVKGTFAMPFHHPVNEGAVTCSDCHDVHGTFKQNNLRSTVDQNQICTKCHVETRGPFVYEHAAVKAEGCVGCHTPHGSQNARLLNMPSINTLCNQCHSPVAAGTIHSMNAGSSELTSCVNCHTMIHGSNLNQAFLK
jgi:DmsE family decaheme c-type cytochrome